MKFGIALPNCVEGMVFPVPFASPKQMIELAKKAEAFGYDSVWANDHMATQKYVAEKGKVPPNYYEPLITLAAAARATERILLITGLVVLPLRDPMLLAKQLCTLDQISNGRFALGVGLGAYREEFNALRPRWKEKSRAKIMDESLGCLRKLLTERVVTFSGEFFQCQDLEMFPKPIQKPFPIYIGGNSDEGMRRVAKYGMGWYPAALSPHAIQERLPRLTAYLENEGRKLNEVDIAPQVFICIDRNKDRAAKIFKESGLYKHLISLKSSTLKNQDIESFVEFNLIGSPDDIIEKIENYKRAGVTHMAALVFTVQTVEEMEKQMVIFAETVLPAFKEK